MICFRHFCWKWPEGPGHVLCFSFLCNFALTWLEHLHHFLNFCCNFHCNALGHCKYATIFDLTHCDIHSPWLFLSSVGGVAKSYITLMPPVMCMDWLCWRYNHAADVVPSLTALVILLPKWHSLTGPLNQFCDLYITKISNFIFLMLLSTLLKWKYKQF